MTDPRPLPRDETRDLFGSRVPRPMRQAGLELYHDGPAADRSPLASPVPLDPMTRDLFDTETEED